VVSASALRGWLLLGASVRALRKRVSCVRAVARCVERENKEKYLTDYLDAR
jgi:hypothetical protein